MPSAKSSDSRVYSRMRYTTWSYSARGRTFSSRAGVSQICLSDMGEVGWGADDGMGAQVIRWPGTRFWHLWLLRIRCVVRWVGRDGTDGVRAGLVLQSRSPTPQGASSQCVDPPILPRRILISPLGQSSTLRRLGRPSSNTRQSGDVQTASSSRTPTAVSCET